MKRFLVVEWHGTPNDGFHTVQGFWECECETNYIHRTVIEKDCPVCQKTHDECPDARLTEILSQRRMLTDREFAALGTAIHQPCNLLVDRKTAEIYLAEP